jgi:hypothetical protein
VSLAVILALTMAVLAFAVATARPLSDPDVYWHLASARWMVEHGELLTRDPFSHTELGTPYSVGEWLGQLVWYAAYRLDGWHGIVVLRGLVVALTSFCLTLVTLLAQPRPAFAILPIGLGLFVSGPMWTERPHLFTFALASLFFLVLFAQHQGRAGRAIWALPPLSLLWSNLHGGYPVGIVLLALFAAVAFLERRPHARVLLIVTVAASALTFVNPGSLGADGALSHVLSPPRFIQEELPPDVFSRHGAAFAVLLLVAIGSALVLGGLPLIWAIALPPLVWLGLSAQRHLPVAVVALAPFVAYAAPLAVARLWPRVRLAEPRRLFVRPFFAGTFVVLAAGSAVSFAAGAPTAPDETEYPSQALAALATVPDNLLNEYDWGGYLIWNAPEHQVFIDGRLFVFLPEVFADYREAVQLGPNFKSVLAERGIAAALLRPTRPLAVYLRESGWRVAAERSDAFVLLVRP